MPRDFIAAALNPITFPILVSVRVPLSPAKSTTNLNGPITDDFDARTRVKLNLMK